MKMKKKSGFSLIELMVAIFIISTTLLLVIGVFSMLFNATQKGIDLTVGTSAGESILEEYIYSNQETIRNNGGEAVEASINKTINGIQFLCRINVSESIHEKVRKINATVYWWLTPDGNNVANPRSYRVMTKGGFYETVTPGPGSVAEYGLIKTEIVKMIFLPPKN